MTANLLTHSNDFACGIARSGAYNRTLTPLVSKVNNVIIRMFRNLQRNVTFYERQ